MWPAFVICQISAIPTIGAASIDFQINKEAANGGLFVCAPQVTFLVDGA